MFQNRHGGFQRAQLHENAGDVHMQDAEPLITNGFTDLDDETIHQSTEDETALQPQRNRLIIAIDFGTTFSTVAYVAIEHDRPGFSIKPQHVLCVDHYPDIPSVTTSANLLELNENVPTELWYVEGVPEDDRSSPDSSEVDLTGYYSDASEEGLTTGEALTENGRTRNEKHRQYLWGFGVHQNQLASRDTGDRAALVRRFKLMLDSDGKNTEDLRKEISRQTTLLKRRKAIAYKEQMISDYLEQLLKHAKTRLEATGDLDLNSQIEFVLCVPNLWTETASWIMHDAMVIAIKSVGFGGLTKECVDNLFIVAEPEAAAEFVLSSFLEKRQIRAGETFVMLDAGGGTVDATTYKVTRSDPVRLERQAIAHGADSCGSSFLNDGYEQRIKQRLEGEVLAFRGSQLDHYIDRLVTTWENGEKRRIDVTNKRRDPNDLCIMGLKADREKNFIDNYMRWSRDDMKAIFDPVLIRVIGVLAEQLKAAKEEETNLNVTKVVLIGGFSESPSLVQVLRGYLARPHNFNIRDVQIELLVPEKFRTSAVARGAVLRALRKEHGPERRSRSSFGFKRHELHDPDNVPQHKGVSVKIDPVDGFETIDNTIFWVIQQVSLRASN